MDRKLTPFETVVLEKSKINCGDLSSLLYEYVEREMTTELQGKLDSHVKMCSECQEFVGSYKMVSAVAREIGRATAPISSSTRMRLREGLSRRLGIVL